MNVKSSTKLPVTYVFDAYCGWCYGFSNAFSQFVDAYSEQLDLTVISGGLFVGERIQPVANLPFIKTGNVRIAELTGAKFGEGYLQTIGNPNFVMNSEDAAVGFAALRTLAPEKSLMIAKAMQYAFYWKGLSLSEVSTYQKIADDLGIAKEAVLTGIQSDQAREEARKDFLKAQNLGVHSFPTVLVQLSNNKVLLGDATSSAEQLSQNFIELLKQR